MCPRQHARIELIDGEQSRRLRGTRRHVGELLDRSRRAEELVEALWYRVRR